MSGSSAHLGRGAGEESIPAGATLPRQEAQPAGGLRGGDALLGEGACGVEGAESGGLRQAQSEAGGSVAAEGGGGGAQVEAGQACCSEILTARFSPTGKTNSHTNSPTSLVDITWRQAHAYKLPRTPGNAVRISGLQFLKRIVRSDQTPRLAEGGARRDVNRLIKLAPLLAKGVQLWGVAGHLAAVFCQ